VGADTDEVRRMRKPLQMRLIGGGRGLQHGGGRRISKKSGTKIEEEAAAYRLP
jgi:hypothetical protein